MAGVVFDMVGKTFDDVVAVDDLSLEIHDEEFLVLLGPSGCGKSTALRMIAGLQEPTTGTIRIGDDVVNGVDPKVRDVSMVFQSYALYPHLTAARNIAFPLKPRGVPKDERKALVDDAAEMLGLTQLLGRKPGQLSGGQRQRVALARAIVRQPRVFLMDEPLSNLDAKMRIETRSELVDLHKRLRTTFVYVTHDQVEAMTMADRVAILDQGRLQQVGPPQEVYDRPANLFVASFIGSPPMNTVPAVVMKGSAAGKLEIGGYEVDIGDRLAGYGADAVVVGVRPEHLRFVSDAEDGVGAQVDLVESLGHEIQVSGSIGESKRLIVRLDADDVPPAVGDTVRIAADLERIHLFDPGSTERID
jgi:multiple sugar transport system ATP-binding protein